MSKVINQFFLWIVLLPSTVYQKFGIDLVHLKSILAVKLMMDDRRTGLFNKSRQTDKPSDFATVIMIVVAFVIGAVFLFAFRFTDDITRLTLYFSFVMFMLCLFLIADFTHVLIDVRDNFIILPKPVTAKTFLTARILHIIIHLSRLTVPMILPGLVIIALSRGIWGAIVLVPTIFLLVLFTIFLVNTAYLAIMKLFSPERFNSIITTIQITFTIVAYAGFQLAPKFLDDDQFLETQLNDTGLIWLLPGFWFAGAWKMFYTLSPDATVITCALLSIVMPLSSILLVVKYFAPSFQRKLSLISTGAGQEVSPDGRISRRKDTPGFLRRLSQFMTSPGVERGAFLFTWKMISRYRDFKLKVYPQIGYIAVLLVLIFYKHIKAFIFSDQQLIVDYRIPMLTMMYMTGFIFLAAVQYLPYSDSFKASWIFFVSPLEKPGSVISGAIKAGILKFCLPLMVVVVVPCIVLAGPVVIPNLLFGFGNVLAVCFLISFIALDRFPFSVALKDDDQGLNTIRSMIMLIFLPIVGIPHYFLYDKVWFVGGLSIVSYTVAFLLMRKIKSRSWGNVKYE